MSYNSHYFFLNTNKFKTKKVIAARIIIEAMVEIKILDMIFIREIINGCKNTRIKYQKKKIKIEYLFCNGALKTKAL